jgi:hypothetical protein
MRYVVALLLLVAGPAKAGHYSPQESSVDGVVIRSGSDTNEPVPYARVLLTKIEGQLADARAVTADDRGRFAFSSVPPGRYRMFAQHGEFVRAEGTPLAVEAGRLTPSVTLTLVPTGVISGRVVDGYGDPVADVYVRAAAKASGTFETQTNDLGEYRLFGLPPGAYVVSAAPYTAPRVEGANLVTPTPPGPYSRGEGQGMMPVARLLQNGDFINPMALKGESYVRMYYPAGADPAAAEAIEVRPGAVTSGIDFTTATVPRPRF